MLRLTTRRILRRSHSTLYKAIPNSRPLSTTPHLGPRWINDKPRARLSTQRRGGAPESSALEKKAELSADDAKSNDAASSSNAGATSGGNSGGNDNEDDNSSSNKSTSLTKNTPPSYFPRVLALPINRRPLFPGFYKAVVIKNPQVVSAIKEMMQRGQPYLGAFLHKDPDSESDVINSMDECEDVGVFAQITSAFPTRTSKSDDDKESGNNNNNNNNDQEESLTAVLYPHRRIRIDELYAPGVKPPKPRLPSVEDARDQLPQEVKEASPEEEKQLEEAHKERRKAEQSHPLQTAFLEPFNISLVDVTHLKIPPATKPHSQTTKALMSELINVFKDIAQLNPLFRDQIANFSVSQSASNIFEEPDKLADFAAAVSQGEISELQAVLEAENVEDRLGKALVVLKRELINAQLQSKISRDVESKIQKRQREFYLMEQLKGIKRELGLESDGKDKMLEKFKSKSSSLAIPEPVRKVIDEEISKLSTLEQASSEFAVTRNYLDWLTSIPWGQHSTENFSLPHATKVLDEDHYGLKDVKDRILEFLAVGKLRGSVEGKIICLVGPPGVGKTSIGKSVARALGRQFFRFSVGGLTDVAEIKGHRRTYVGAMPGKIVQALKKVQTENPLVLIDEIDKVGKGYNGDPSSALLEMLDPEQNNQFLDHYLDVPLDLSKVLFVSTANVLDTVPAPLLDRMEVIEVSGYVADEKAAIAERYLAPQAKESSGLKDADVTLSPEAIETLIRSYARESGVRNLKKHIEKIYRKAALGIVKDLGEESLPEDKAQDLEKTTTIPSETPKPNEVQATSSSTTTATEPTSSTSSSQQSLQKTSKNILSNFFSSSAEPAKVSAKSNNESKSQLEDNKTPEVSNNDQSRSKESTPEEGETTRVSSQPRKPLEIPSTVSLKITPDNLSDYVGPAIYQKDRLYSQLPPAGVSTGLGYLGNGSGAVMPIESRLYSGKGSLQLTGKLGEVIRESAQIALSFIKSNANQLGLDKDVFKDRDLHLHMPEGAIGKDGPSAGTAITTALVSLLTGLKVDPDLAMTGEITLVGQICAVGGLREKLLAAKRAGVKRVLIPQACKADVDANVPQSVKEGLDLVFVEEYNEVLKYAFGSSHHLAKHWEDNGLMVDRNVRHIHTSTPPPSTSNEIRAR
ncbi:ATP-dependent protease La [Wallemia mellicola]|uniref:Lon protease homolog, mitochondrial n=1 Tax=Wallemia mellicola TaxID=1708541 RepID=A0A4V4MUG7_9BASI|nr:ATP-dependent protease La [Wallemia mellicola]TIC00071.1 ATP-dependent protease La [Wallemia mellicola]TIC11844.1 ATP-dependent protease La [Wallemia mellicola]TIC29893.1 ATP-dependent protease La [Wallemia mellicola]TIC52689.1 ATP-dependent protease La [Wallemia mellicola]